MPGTHAVEEHSGWQTLQDYIRSGRGILSGEAIRSRSRAKSTLLTKGIRTYIRQLSYCLSILRMERILTENMK